MVNKESQISGLYAIADYHYNPLPTLTGLIRKYLEGGCRLIQLRVKPNVDGACGAKHAAQEEISGIANQIMKFKKEWDFTFIINDHVNIAATVGADGVHVGANDPPVSEIKKIYGSKLLVGYSSHSLEEAKRAEADGADYIAFGAIFPTATKGPDHPIQGIEKLREVVNAIGKPIVAIGGIKRQNLSQIIDSGASAAAMITALTQADDISSETKWYVEKLKP